MVSSHNKTSCLFLIDACIVHFQSRRKNGRGTPRPYFSLKTLLRLVLLFLSFFGDWFDYFIRITRFVIVWLPTVALIR